MRWLYVPKGSNPCPSYIPGKYTVNELDQMIFVDGYIPVATATEFDKIRTGASETMGVGTCWENTYTTGTDKKYVQVLEIDFTGYTTLSAIPTFSGTYDGNQLQLTDLTDSHALFNSSTGILRHIQINGFKLDSTAIDTGILVNVVTSGIINDCYTINCEITNGDQRQGGLIGRIDAVTGSLSITDCGVTNATISGSTQCGLFVSTVNDTNNLTQIRNCFVSYSSLTSSGTLSGGFVGRHVAGIDAIQNCYINNISVTGVSSTGGFIGRCDIDMSLCRATNVSVTQTPTTTQVNCAAFVGDANNCDFDDCYVTGSITATGNRVGGFIGNGANTNFTNCYALVNVQGRNVVGGFHGALSGSSAVNNCYCAGTLSGIATLNGFGAGGTVSNSYWDKTIGYPTSSTGSGQTTSDLQTPTSNTGIYSAWTIPPWDFGTDTEYPKLL